MSQFVGTSMFVGSFGIAEVLALLALIFNSRKGPGAFGAAFTPYLWMWAAVTIVDCYLIGQGVQSPSWTPLIAALVTAFHGLVVNAVRKAQQRSARRAQALQ